VDTTAGYDFPELCDKKVHINICPVLDGDGFMGIFNSRKRQRKAHATLNQLAGNVFNLVAYRLCCKHFIAT
jgi:hypothetical protein